MVIECPRCESKVQAQVIGEVEPFDSSLAGDPEKAVLLKCSVCQSPILGASQLVQAGKDEWEWSEATRLWPEPEDSVDWSIPEIARNSLVEAKRCFKVRAYSACAVMVGRAIEGVCKHHKTKKTNLAGGLRELKEKGLIDEMIFGWGEELRKHRNIGAHASLDEISQDDARDLLDFGLAICEYVFVLHVKFRRFQQRRTTQ